MKKRNFFVVGTILVLGGIANSSALQSQTNGKSGEDVKLEEAKKVTAAKLEELKRIVEGRELEWKSASRRSRGGAENAGEAAKRVLGEAVEATKKAPTKIVPLAPRTPVVDTPAVVEQEEGLERLRRNQRALTDQRIGDVIILRANQ